MTNNQYRSQPMLTKMTLSLVQILLCYSNSWMFILWPKSSPSNWGRLRSSTTHHLSCSHNSTARQINDFFSCKKRFFVCEKQTQHGIHYHYGDRPTMFPRLSLSIFGVYSRRISMYQLCVHIDLWRAVSIHQQPNGFCISCKIYSGTLNWHRETSKCLLCC